MESPFLLCLLKTLKGRKETDSPKTSFWTTVSLHDAFSAPLARSGFSKGSYWNLETCPFNLKEAYLEARKPFSTFGSFLPRDAFGKLRGPSDR